MVLRIDLVHGRRSSQWCPRSGETNKLSLLWLQLRMVTRIPLNYRGYVDHIQNPTCGRFLPRTYARHIMKRQARRRTARLDKIRSNAVPPADMMPQTHRMASSVRRFEECSHSKQYVFSRLAHRRCSRAQTTMPNASIAGSPSCLGAVTAPIEHH